VLSLKKGETTLSLSSPFTYSHHEHHEPYFCLLVSLSKSYIHPVTFSHDLLHVCMCVNPVDGRAMCCCYRN